MEFHVVGVFDVHVGMCFIIIFLNLQRKLRVPTLSPPVSGSSTF